jgi:hypothetical protein
MLGAAWVLVAGVWEVEELSMLGRRMGPVVNALLGVAAFRVVASCVPPTPVADEPAGVQRVPVSTDGAVVQEGESNVG